MSMYVHGKVLVRVYECTVIEMIFIPNQPTPCCTSMRRQCMCQLVHACIRAQAFLCAQAFLRVVHVFFCLHGDTKQCESRLAAMSCCHLPGMHDTMLGA